MSRDGDQARGNLHRLCRILIANERQWPRIHWAKSNPYARWCGARGWFAESVTGIRFALIFDILQLALDNRVIFIIDNKYSSLVNTLMHYFGKDSIATFAVYASIKTC